jgi:hypothetical protein
MQAPENMSLNSLEALAERLQDAISDTVSLTGMSCTPLTQTLALGARTYFTSNGNRA